MKFFYNFLQSPSFTTPQKEDLSQLLSLDMATYKIVDFFSKLYASSFVSCNQKEIVVIKVYGKVQGVGFRPFIYNLATTLKLYGYVRNMGDCVEILLFCKTKQQSSNIKSFLFSLLCKDKKHFRDTLSKLLDSNTSNLAQSGSIIESLQTLCNDSLALSINHCAMNRDIESLSLVYFANLNAYRQSDNALVIESEQFSILDSKNTPKTLTLQLPLDYKVCEECLKDIKDNTSRFYHYAFTSCVNCGARYSILNTLPYDRDKTTMKQFKLCRACNHDYNNVNNRRFHTEPISCNECKIEIIAYQISLENETTPQHSHNLHAIKSFYNHDSFITLLCNNNTSSLNHNLSNHTSQTPKPQITALQRNLEALNLCIKALCNDEVVLFKGLGGFAFLANARSNQAIQTLRNIKSRPNKPFAIMALLPTLRNIASITPSIETMLSSPQSPIILTLKHQNYNLSPFVCNLETIGVMIPYTAMLYLLFERLPKDFVLVYTSANKKGEMIATDLGELDCIKILESLHTISHLQHQDTANKIYATFPLSIKQVSLQQSQEKYIKPLSFDTKNLNKKILTSNPIKLHHTQYNHIQQKQSKQHSLLVLDYSREIAHKLDDSIMLGIDSAMLNSYTQYCFHEKNMDFDTPKNLTQEYNQDTTIKPQKEGDNSKQSCQKNPFYDLASQKSCFSAINHLRSMRLSRGFAPLNLYCPTLKLHVLSAGFGAMQKSSIAFGQDQNIVATPYLGDLFNPSNIAYFQATFSHFSALYGMPEIFITDKHPHYTSTAIAQQIANENNIAIYSISHHHAHLNALLLESQSREGIGVLFDGSGLGDDGNIWGGEFLMGNYKEVKRFKSFKPFRILGGEKHIKDSTRLILSYALCNNLSQILEYLQEKYYTQKELQILQSMEKMGLNSPFTSSVGRIFDIAGFILGLERLSYEGESGEIIASLALQSHKTQILQHLTSSPLKHFVGKPIKFFDSRFYNKTTPFNPYPFEVTNTHIDLKECILAMFIDSQNGVKKDIIALRFLDTLAFCILESLRNIGTDSALFGGGVFANFMLCERIKTLLNKYNIHCFFPKLPCNDYSISIGQLAFVSQI